MTYKGIVYRLDLPTTFPIHAIVHSRPELFRQGVPRVRLDAWKADIKDKPLNRPSWTRNLGTEDERLQAIDGITNEDVFRSTFRTESGAPRTEVHLIDWGLQHIERLRIDQLERRGEATKQREFTWTVVLGLFQFAVLVFNVAILGFNSWVALQLALKTLTSP